jgi:uncharacterized protein (TIGR03086 family)
MTGNADPLHDLDRACAATGELVARIRDEQWSAHTGCPDWTVRDLVNHLVSGNLFFAALLRDQPPPDRSDDHLGADPVTAYRRAAADLAAAFAEPGAFDRAITVPAGTVPGVVALHLRITEYLVHGWDLAHATAQPTDGLPTDLAETELRLAQAHLAHVPRGGHPFGPAQPAPGDATALDRLAAYLGRPLGPRAAA